MMSNLTKMHEPKFFMLVGSECRCDHCRIQAAVTDIVYPNGMGAMMNPQDKIAALLHVAGNYMARVLTEEESAKMLREMTEGIGKIRGIEAERAKRAEAMAQEPAGQA